MTAKEKHDEYKLDAKNFKNAEIREAYWEELSRIWIEKYYVLDTAYRKIIKKIRETV